MKRIVSFFLFFLAVSTVVAQEIPGQFVVELEGEPAAAFAIRNNRKAVRTDAQFQTRAAQIAAQHATTRRAVESSGGRVLDSTQAVMNALIVSQPAGASVLAAIPGVVRVYPVRMYQKTLDRAIALHSVPDAWNLSGGMANAGLGIKIAIIDTGIDSTHPGFQDPSLPPVAGFPIVNQNSDLTFTNNKIIVARAYTGGNGSAVTAQDVDGHGTGVAMCAAGVTNSGFYGTITGVAPKAYLGSYKVFPTPNSGAPTNIILKAIDDAVADGMDILSLSLGSTLAGLPDGDVLVRAVESAVAAGRIVTVAAGNGGPDLDTMSSPGTAPNVISVGAMRNDRVFSGALRVGDNPNIAAIPGAGANTASPISGPLSDVASLDSTALACGSLPAASLSGQIVLILRGVCTFEVKLNNAARAGAIAAVIYTDAARPDAATIDPGAATLPTAMLSYQDGIAVKQQIAAAPVTATLDFSTQPSLISPYLLASFSSLGPNLDFGIKPDLVAAGANISTAKPLANDGSAKDGYVVEGGTSFSTPIVAGAAAVLKAARPGLSAPQYRSLLVNSAAQFPTPVDIQRTGVGFLNLAASVQNQIASAPVSLSFGYGGGGVNQTLSFTLTNLGSASDFLSVSVAPLNSGAAPTIDNTSFVLDPGQSKQVNLQLNQSGLDPGTYQGYIMVQSTQSAVMTRVPYWYAASDGVPAHVTVLDQPTTGTRNSIQSIYFRVTDAEGIPSQTAPQVTYTTGGGRIVSVQSQNSQYPGVFLARVQLGASGGNIIQLSSGAASTNVTITVP